jgi:WD40 repeat protein
MKDDMTFSTVGINQYKQWTASQTGLIGKGGSFGTANAALGVCRYMGELCLSGAITGELYVWQGTGIKQTLKLHQGHLDAITVTPKYVFTGGKDSKVNVLQTGTLTALFSFSLTDAALGFNSVLGKVRAIALNDTEDIMYLGTLGAEIFQVNVNIPGKTVQKPKRLVVGHYSPSTKYTNEVWGLEVTPDTDKYISTSDDGTLRLWDAKLRSQIKFVNLAVDQSGQALPMDPATNELSDASKARCVDVKPKGDEVAVGFLDGSVRVYAFPAFQEKKRFQVVKKLAAGKNQVLGIS